VKFIGKSENVLITEMEANPCGWEFFNFPIETR